MLKIEVLLVNGSTYTITCDKSEEEFKDLIKFDNGTTFFEDSENGYVLIKNIIRFKFI